MTFIKICGITRREDARAAVEAGATALGFVFWPQSPRCLEPEAAAAIVAEVPPSITTVGVFVDQPLYDVERIAERSGVGTIQLHGEEPASYAAALKRPVIKAMSLRAAETLDGAWGNDTLILLDAYDPERRGGTGQPLDWPWAARIASRRRVVLAGGLTPDNVHEAIHLVRPFGVDVSSGVERSPGVKDSAKMVRFLEQVRRGRHGQSDGF
jgi:phosphoribosylanthranilate isomerase